VISAKVSRHLLELHYYTLSLRVERRCRKGLLMMPVSLPRADLFTINKEMRRSASTSIRTWFAAYTDHGDRYVLADQKASPGRLVTTSMVVSLPRPPP